MKLGNDYFGITTDKGYHCIRLFPLGIELCLFDDKYEICITLGIIELDFGIKISRLFKN